MVDTWRLGVDGVLYYGTKKLNIGELVKRDTNGVSTLDGSALPLYVQLADNALAVGNTPVDELVTTGNILEVLPVTEDPILSSSGLVVEGGSLTINIVNYDPNNIYFINSDLNASIGNIANDGTFVYTAPLTDSVNDVLDTLRVYTSSVGKVRSFVIEHPITIQQLSLVTDQVLSNTDFNINQSYNDGFLI